MSAYDHSSQIADLKSRIKPIRFAMFTTINADAVLASRPMTSQDMDDEGNLWFYTSTTTQLWEDIVTNPQVNLSFSEPSENVYVSISGRAERVVEREKIRALWNPAVQAWYPHGPDDPHVMLVRVVPHAAEYWDSSASNMVQMFNMAKAVLTGSTPADSEHAKLDL